MEELNKFLDWVKKTKSENTYRSYKKTIEIFAFWLKKNNKTSLDISNKEAMEFYDYLIENYPAKRSIANRISALKSLYKYLISIEAVSKNPFVSIQVRLEQLLPKPLTYSQLKVILKEASLKDERVYLAIFSLVSLGLRVSELLALKKEDFYFNKILKVRVLGKGKKERYTISIFKSFDDKIKKFLIDKKPKERVFTFTARCLGYWCQKLSKETGIKFTPHTLRHTYATLLVKNKISFEKISKLLGHSNINTTMIYAKIGLEDIEDEIKKIRGDRSLIPLSYLRKVI